MISTVCIWLGVADRLGFYMKGILYLTFTGGTGITSELSKGHVSTKPHESIPTSSDGQTAPAQVNHKQEHRCR